MWWTDSAFDRPVTDRQGINWFFKVWYDITNDSQNQRIFFWNVDKKYTGLMELKDDQVLHFKRIKDRMIKIAKNQTYRERYYCEIKFPIENYY